MSRSDSFIANNERIPEQKDFSYSQLISR